MTCMHMFFLIHTIQEMMDWLAKLCGLPERFLHSAGKGGGGVIQVRLAGEGWRVKGGG